MAGEEIIHVFKWFIFATSMILLVNYIYEILRGSRTGFYRYLTPLSVILINYEEFFLVEIFLEQKYYFQTVISDTSREHFLASIIGIKVFTILLTLFYFLFYRLQFVNKYLDIFILSIFIAYGTTTYGFTIFTGSYMAGLISSSIFLLPVWLLAIRYSLKRFMSISSLSVIIILGFLLNSLHFFDVLTLLSS